MRIGRLQPRYISRGLRTTAVRPTRLDPTDDIDRPGEFAGIVEITRMPRVHSTEIQQKHQVFVLRFHLLRTPEQDLPKNVVDCTTLEQPHGHALPLS